MKKHIKEIGFYVLLAVVFVSVLLLTIPGGPEIKVYSELVKDIHNGEIKVLEVVDNTAYVVYNNDKKAEVSIPSYMALREDVGDVLLSQILKNTVTVDTKKPPSVPWCLRWWIILPMLCITTIKRQRYQSQAIWH